MPTARELLDQADALMRRNRARARDDIPVLTEAVSPETAAQMTHSGLLAERLAEPRERLDSTPTASDVLDDVPILTDAVEEIEVPSVLDPIEPGGEPSAWLDFDDDDARSVIDAAAADSVIVVPDIETPEPGRGETDVERDFDREPPPAGRDDGAFVEPQPVEDALGGAAEIATQPEEEVEQPTALYDQVVDELTTPEDEAVDELTALQDDAVAEEFAPRSDESAVVEESAAQPDEPVVVEEFAAQPDESAGAEATNLPAWPAMEENTTSVPALLAHDDVRWMAMAEEIRMQVLQRIDLFTDIGLREQLGLHLQPIVDRASAELVVTISREVGELLRAYVAETIEREIERWRRESGEIR